MERKENFWHSKAIRKQNGAENKLPVVHIQSLDIHPRSGTDNYDLEYEPLVVCWLITTGNSHGVSLDIKAA